MRSRAALTPLVGRTEQISQIREAFGTARLVSLLGVGGIGKSRLAAAVALELGLDLPDGSAVVELGATTDARHLRQLVRETVAPASNEQAPLEDVLSAAQMLLVMDRCEHLMPEVAVFIAELLEQCPGLWVLATSRLPLSIHGEYLFRVPPMGVSGDTQDAPSEAAQLFLLRARAETGEPSKSSLPAIEELCRRLDGLPLAIELAAIRTRTVSVAEMLEGITYRFALLQHSSVTGERRSIEAVLLWSWEHCSPQQQQLWAEFSVFVGAVPLGSITEVCGFTDTFAAADAIDGLMQRSLLLRSDTAGGVTFRMLDTIAAFGAQRRADDDTERFTELHRRHALHYASLVHNIARNWFGPEQQRMSGLLRTHIPNVRAAFANCLDEPQLATTAIAIFRDLWTYWIACGHLGEARVWARQLVAAAPTGYERALWVAGWAELLLGDLDTAMDYLTICQQNSSETSRGNYVAMSLLAACRAIHGDFGFAAEQYRVGIGQARTADDLFAVTLLTQNYAEIATIGGDLDAGRRACVEVEAICERNDESWIYSHILWVKALGALFEDRYADALEFALQSLRLKSRIHDQLGTALVAEVYAWACGCRGDLHTAAVALGATSTYWKGTDRPLLGFARLQQWRARCLNSIRSVLDPGTYAQAQTQGRDIGLQGLITELERHEHLGIDPESRQRSVQLTNREREIALLVSNGLGNRQIADQLYISTRTVETHVSHVLSKLNLTRRSQIRSALTADDHDLAGQESAAPGKGRTYG